MTLIGDNKEDDSLDSGTRVILQSLLHGQCSLFIVMKQFRTSPPDDRAPILSNDISLFEKAAALIQRNLRS